MLFLLVLFSCKNVEDQTIKRTSIVMGSSIEIQIRGENQVKAIKAIDAAFAEARRIDTLFSTYINNNPMWIVNNTFADEMIVEPEMFYMLQLCDSLWRSTEGAFDPAIGNLIDLIGFQKDSPKMPSNSQIQKVLSQTGWKKIKLIEPNILSKPEGIKISFNACVPGYASDRISNMLYNYGIKDFLVNVGGEIYASGSNWKIGIQHPRRQNEMLGVINVNKFGVATSGDYEQFFKHNGKRVTHIFNPITGLPAGECEAVTIIAKDAMTADALSTAVFVLGPKEGMRLIEKLNDVEGIIVDTLGAIHQSSNFEKFIKR